jgi:hypothetical protein
MSEAWDSVRFLAGARPESGARPRSGEFRAGRRAEFRKEDWIYAELPFNANPSRLLNIFGEVRGVAQPG